MKKLIAMALALMTVLSACGTEEPNVTNNNYNYKTGLATYTHTNNTYGTTEDKNGQSSVSTTIVAAVFDDKGKIIDIKIDEVESKTGFDNKGRLVGYTGNEVVSKKELGDSYGMKAVSGIGKEWYQQIETLEKWLVGKDVNTVINTGRSRMGGMNNNTNNGMNGNMDDGYGMWNGAGYDNWNNNNMAPRNNTNDATPYANGANGNTNAGDMVGDTIDGVGEAIDNAADNIMGGADNNSNNNSGNSGTATTAPNGTNNNLWNSADLTAGVTIDTTYIQRAIEKAYRNAK